MYKRCVGHGATGKSVDVRQWGITRESYVNGGGCNDKSKCASRILDYKVWYTGTRFMVSLVEFKSGKLIVYEANGRVAVQFLCIFENMCCCHAGWLLYSRSRRRFVSNIFTTGFNVCSSLGILRDWLRLVSTVSKKSGFLNCSEEKPSAHCSTSALRLARCTFANLLIDE